MIRKYLMQQWYGIKTRNISAAHRQQRLAVLYFFMAWNCFGFTLYFLLKDKIPTDPEGRRQSVLSLTGAPYNLHVYQIEGLSLKNEFDVKKEDLTEGAEEIE